MVKCNIRHCICHFFSCAAILVSICVNHNPRPLRSSSGSRSLQCLHAVVSYVHAGSSLYTGFDIACVFGSKHDEDQKIILPRAARHISVYTSLMAVQIYKALNSGQVEQRSTTSNLMVNRKRLYRANGQAYHSNDQGVDGKLWVAVTSSVDLVMIGSGLGQKLGHI